MVLMPEFKDEIIPFAKLAVDLGVDYGVIKHCSDDEMGTLGVDYSKYDQLYSELEEAESYSNDTTKIIVKWDKIKNKGKPSYKRFYGPQFLLQISGSGLVAPSGMFLMLDILNYISVIMLMKDLKIFLNLTDIGKL